MDDESAKIIGFFITYVIGGIVLGFLAAHKNRSYWAWGVIGGLFWFPCIIALVLLPPLCIKCQRPLTRDEARRGACPSCGTQAKKLPSEQEGYALLEKATKLEVKGQVRQAIVAYQEVIEEHPGTLAAHDAEKSLKSLRAEVG